MLTLRRYLVVALLLALALLGFGLARSVRAATESGAVGIQGTIAAPPPSVGAVISIPGSGSTFTDLPITVSGICTGDVLVKLFKNDVFSGSTPCENGSFQISIDLFSGKNDLVARVYDALDQAGPDSNLVTVTYSDNSSNAQVANRVLLTSNYAKRGANPREKLSWPLILTGGYGPYAVSIDWGDSNNDLQSVTFPGEFIIEHEYQNSGVYKVIVKAVDSRGATAYIQLVAVANGPLSQVSDTSSSNDQAVAAGKTIILWQPAAILIPFILSTFWLGKRYEVKRIRRSIEDGKRPF